MITIFQARKLTGIYLKNQTDDQVQLLLNQLYGIVGVAVDQSILSGSNKKREVIELPTEKAENGSRRA